MGKTESMVIELDAIETKVATIRLIGDTPLIVHKWSEKAKREMLDKQTKKATTAKGAKDPWLDYCNSMYWMDGMPEYPTQEDIDKARFGFPTIAFKAAAIDGAFWQGALTKKTGARGAFIILGELTEIKGKPTIREDVVRVGGMTKVADLRYRGEFKDWETSLTIKYIPAVMEFEQIVNMFRLGGFACGVGEWRPSKDGTYGCFHVASNGE